LDDLGGRSTTFVFDVVDGVGAAAVVSLSLVDLIADFSVVDLATIGLDVNLGVLVRTAGALISSGMLARASLNNVSGTHLSRLSSTSG
jgi:hypothetical protein